jgi:hypothetical protein
LDEEFSKQDLDPLDSNGDNRPTGKYIIRLPVDEKIDFIEDNSDSPKWSSGLKQMRVIRHF